MRFDLVSSVSARTPRHPGRRSLGGVGLLVAAVMFAANVACGSHPTALGGGGGGTGTSDNPNGSGGGGSNGGNGGGGGFDVDGSGGGGGDDSGAPISAPPPAPGVPFVRDDTGTSGLDANTITQLKMGGGSCSIKPVYPYDGTMFPVSGLPPIIQWPQSSDSAYVKMTYGDEKQVDYEFAVKTPAVMMQYGPIMGPVGEQLTIPQDAWDGVSSQTPRTKQTPLQITFTVIAGGTVSTCQLSWLIAPGELEGTLYYNTYDDPNIMPMGVGSVMRIFLGQASPQPYLWYSGMADSSSGPCISCHSVSANGSTMAATLHHYGLFDPTFTASAYDIKTHTNPQPPPISQGAMPSATFGGLTPDGNYLLTMGNPDCTGGADTYPRSANNFPLVEGPTQAKLWDVHSSMPVTASGLDATHFMWMPQFSPNGDKVVFNNATLGSNGRTNRRQLATMDYDAATHTFSNLQVLYTDNGPAPSLPYAGYGDSAGGGPIPGSCNAKVGQYNDTCTDLCYPSWPFFTPDGKKVIFARGTEPDFVSIAPGLGRTSPSLSRLFIVDVTTKVAHELSNANGQGLVSSGDLSHEYIPTMMPVAAGGQFWIFWTSRRTYGIFPQTGGKSWNPVGGMDPISYPDAKKIWVSAIDIGAPDSVDPSHPGFFLRGQGDSGNLRAFATLNPCRADGTGTANKCGSGLDCCSGLCVNGYCSAPPTVKTCSALNNKCTDSSDCCANSPPYTCLGGFCAEPPPPK